VRVRLGWDGGNRIGEVLRRHVVALLCVVALIGTAVGIAIASPPSSEMPDDFHGRTWLSVASTSGPQLVLVNGISGLIEPDRPLVDGVVVETDLGPWTVHEMPGHAPSHVCLFQAERRLLISGDHLLGRVSLYYDYGYTPDPAGEFLHSLDVVEDLDARLCLAGHGRTFADVQAHIAANRRLVAERVQKVLDVVTFDGPISAFDAVPRVYGEPMTPLTANWRLSEALCYLRHLEVTGRIQRVADDEGVERWQAAA